VKIVVSCVGRVPPKEAVASVPVALMA